MNNSKFKNISNTRLHQHVGESIDGYTKKKSCTTGNYYMKKDSTFASIDQSCKTINSAVNLCKNPRSVDACSEFCENVTKLYLEKQINTMRNIIIKDIFSKLL